MTSTTGRTSMPSTIPEKPPEQPMDLSPRELLRWTWRQLTSMRTALILLFLLALGAVPGSVVPQEKVDSLRASQWREAHPSLTPIYDKLGLFDVYGSFWFAAIYLLLIVSLLGCIVPRTLVYWRGLRAEPPPVPRRLDRLPEHRTFTTDASPEEVVAAARASLKKRRYRLGPEAATAVSAERGFLREAGNLVFHLAVLVVLAGFGIGSLFGFRGGVVVITGDTFSNTLSQYDDFAPGKAFGPDDLAPFSFEVKDFTVKFITSGRSAGAAQDFKADLAVRSTPSAKPFDQRIAVNHPLTVDGTKVFLIGHGYAPHITVRDGEGNIAYSGAKVFLPENETFTSFGVIKAADARPKQIGLEGELYPTYAFSKSTGPFSAFPDAKDPGISMTVWTGDLGLDDGTPQSVYALDKSKLTAVPGKNGAQARVDLRLGSTTTLPDGLGTVTFDGMSRFVRLQVSETPGTGLTLAGTVLALLGLLASLFVRPRRMWVRARREGDRTIVEVAGLDRSSGGDLTGELEAVTADLAGPAAGPAASERPKQSDTGEQT